jgi:hypothetical protein
MFVCELKEFEHVEPSEKDGWEITIHRDGSIEASNDSNATNRISWDIRRAYKQLAQYSEPKVLVFLNHTYMLNCTDLEETYRGYRMIEVDLIRIRNTYAARASNGLIKDIKSRIDLYIWIDTPKPRIDLQEDRVTFLFVTEIGRRIALDNFFVPGRST